MSARCLITKYSPRNSKKAIVNYYKIPATNKWVEYMLDKQDADSMLMRVDFTTKMDLLETLDILERKIAYMYRHPNFDFKDATFLYNKLKSAPKVAEIATSKVAKKQRK